MSLTPVTPNMEVKPDRKFWTKPDSVFGWLILGGIGAGIIYLWGSVSNFIAAMMVDTLHMGLAALGIYVLYELVTSKRIAMLFRLISRKLTSYFLPIFSFQILDDKISQMRKRRAILGDQISAINGEAGKLRQYITSNKKQAEQNFGKATYAQQHQSSSDPLEAARYAAQVRLNAKKAGRLQNANISYQELLDKLTAIYNTLVKLSINVDEFIDDTVDSVTQLKIKTTAINSAYKAYKTALSIIKGDGVEDEIFDEDVQYLIDEAGRKLGYMDDAQRVAQGFMDNLDIENGAITEQALAQLNDYQTKLLTPGNPEASFLIPTTAKQAVPVLRGKAAASSGDDYSEIFNK